MTTPTVLTRQNNNTILQPFYVISGDELKAFAAEIAAAAVKEFKQITDAEREAPTMTREEAAKALNVSLTTLWRWDNEGFLKPVKIGKKALYRRGDVEALLFTPKSF